MLCSLTTEGTGKETTSAPMTSFPADMTGYEGKESQRNLGSIKSDFRALGAVVKVMRALMAFSSIPDGEDKSSTDCRTALGNCVLNSVAVGPRLHISICLREL